MTYSGLKEKIELYIMSLWVLFLLIAIITFKAPVGVEHIPLNWRVILLISENQMPLVAILFLIIGVIFSVRFDERIKAGGNMPKSIIEIEDQSYEHLTFLTTYIIPLISFNLESIRYTFTLFILLVIIGWIYVMTDKFYANPTLAILGFRIYRVKVNTKTGDEYRIVISKSKLMKMDFIELVDLDRNISFAFRRRGQ